MLMLWPSPGDEVDPVATYALDARPAPADRPWLLVNMIGTVDGAATDAGGLSGGLGGQADKLVFSAVRAVADVIVAGSTTVVAEDYGPPRPSAQVEHQRLARGQAAAPRIAVVSASLHIDPGKRLFQEAPHAARPVILTVARADADRRRALEAVADMLVVGDDRVDWRRALEVLRSSLGAGVVLAEGGPSTIGQLVAHDLVDEMCLTVAPALAGGPAPRIAQAPSGTGLVPLDLDRVLTADGYLFLRYVRDRTVDRRPRSRRNPPAGPASTYG
jgi:riboflavin biosynthesis pyrimidine reductase